MTTKLLAERVAARFKCAMPEIKSLREQGSPIRWCFYTDEEPRMHVQSFDSGHAAKKNQVKIWLETKGKRVFIVAKCPDKDPVATKTIAAKQNQLKNPNERAEIEAEWTRLCIEKQWVIAQIQGDQIALIVYPGTTGSFTRYISLRKEAPARYGHGEPIDVTNKNVKLKLGMDSLAVTDNNGHEFIDIQLSNRLWQD